jgi:signal transduction histidine kinase
VTERFEEAGGGADRAAMARVRHDLLTPLNGVVGYAGILREDALDCGLPELVPELDAILRDARDTVAVLSGVVRSDGGADVEGVAAEVRARCHAAVTRVVRAAESLLPRVGPPAPDTMAADLRRVRDSAATLLQLIDGMREAYARESGA